MNYYNTFLVLKNSPNLEKYGIFEPHREVTLILSYENGPPPEGGGGVRRTICVLSIKKIFFVPNNLKNTFLNFF